MQQNRLAPGRLLDEHGRLAEKGYATALVRDYDRRAVKAGRLRIKEWDYYLVYNDEIGLALTIDDNGYMSMASVSLLDFARRRETTHSPIGLLPMGKTCLPATSAAGRSALKIGGADLEFDVTDGRRRLSCQMRDFAAGQSLEAEIELFDEPADSMVIATPFPEKPTAFYYNQKIIGMRARGTIGYQGRQIELRPEKSFGLLDWGRGVWTYDNTWYWGAGQGLVDGHVFGFNIGYGFGDTSAASENMLFFDGRAHKLDRVSFNIPVAADGRDDYLQPWTFRSSDQRFEMAFEPILDRQALTTLGILMSDQHQVFGYFTGTAILDDGRAVKLDRFLGFAEKVRNKWWRLADPEGHL